MNATRIAKLLGSLRLAPLLAAIACGAAESRPLLSPIFGEHMVLQRGKPNTLWGWAAPGTEVTVTFSGRNRTTPAAADGTWRVVLDSLPASAEPRELVVLAKSRDSVTARQTLHDLLVGDVWLCGGQSNMQFGLPSVVDAAREIAAADRPQIRFFVVGTRSAYAPAEVPRGAWKVCTPQTVAEGSGLSAVAYFFACRVQAETGVPIGLVQDCLGGTPVESWMNAESLKAFPEFDPALTEIARRHARGGPEYGSYLLHWLDEYDRGQGGQPWSDEVFDDGAWKTVRVPGGGFAELGVADVPAVVWFRREIALPDPLPAGATTLHLGMVEKMDTAWINGRWVGASSWVENPRAYRVPPGVLRPGRNEVAVRVFKLKSKAGFLSAPEQIRLAFADGPDLPLDGEWKAALSVDARPPHPLPLGYENYPIMPAVLYQGMIQPVAPLALAGALWYQGEANTNRAWQYRRLLPAMIADWRRAFGQGDFPFLIAGLPAFTPHRDPPGSDGWAELREAQAIAARIVPNCALAVTIDTGDANDIHPRDKRPIGDRLALLALAEHYGKRLVSRGPVFRAAEKADGGAVRLRFDHADGGLVVRGEKLEEFSVAGTDRKWHWATAKLDGADAVIVSSPDVPEPVAVRYAWQANPKATLFNAAGLPAAPFRTDEWPGVTDGKTTW